MILELRLLKFNGFNPEVVYSVKYSMLVDLTGGFRSHSRCYDKCSLTKKVSTMKNFYPIILCPLKIESEYSIFYTLDAEIEVTLPSVLCEELIVLCDGTHSLSTLVDYFSSQWSKESLEVLFDKLIENYVLMDARNISDWAWKFVKNPTAWKPDLSKQEVSALICEQELQKPALQSNYVAEIKVNDWVRQLSGRCSSRRFGTSNINYDSLMRLLWSGCGAVDSVLGDNDNTSVYRRTIPSAGALYPIVLHVCFFRDINEIQSGIYRIISRCPNQVELVLLHKESDKVRKCIVDVSVINNATGVLVISGSVSRSAMKYGNRGLLYTILEAGHSAQNIHLCAQKEGIATLEVGGFFEDELSSQINCSEDYIPLSIVVFGSPEIGEHSVEYDQIHIQDIIRQMEHAPDNVCGYQLPFNMVFIKSITPSTGSMWWSCGRDKSKEMAIVKAQAEAVEWFVCGHVDENDMICATFNDLGNKAIDPREVVSYLPYQFGKVQPFDPGFKYEWLEAENILTGTKHLVLADFVFFPYFPKYGKRYAFGNSSGVAAHTVFEEAVEHAVLENIEREAFMVVWLNSLKRCLIAKESLPSELQERLANLERLDLRVSIVDVTFDLTPVVMVVISGREPPFLSCSTASGYDLIEVVNRSMMEAEASVYCHIRDGHSRLVLTPDEVIRTADHGAFYSDNERIKRADFLFGDNNYQISLSDMKNQIHIHTADQLYDAIEKLGLPILAVNLSHPDRLKDLPYKVVRVLIPGMIPMNFGYGIESLGLSRIKSLPIKCHLLSEPLSDNEINNFPHPFT